MPDLFYFVARVKAGHSNDALSLDEDEVGNVPLLVGREGATRKKVAYNHLFSTYTCTNEKAVSVKKELQLEGTPSHGGHANAFGRGQR